MPIELLLSGYYRGPQTFLGSYTFLKILPGNRWLFAESDDPNYDFAGRIVALGLDRAESAGSCKDGMKTGLCWGHYRRGTNIAALNFRGQVVGQLAEALEATEVIKGVTFQVKIVGAGELQPTTHNVVLTFVPDDRVEPCAAAAGGRDAGSS